jgi:hypothetical protein
MSYVIRGRWAQQPGSESLVTYLTSIEKILPPGFICAAEVADDLAIHMKVVGLRPLEESHSRLLRRAIPFSVVAGAATGDQVIPCRITAARTWDNVVERQVLWRKDVTAVLASVVISQQNVLARKALALEWNVYVFEEPNNRRGRHRESSRVQPLRGTLFSVSDTLQYEHHCPPRRAYIDRLKRSV